MSVDLQLSRNTEGSVLRESSKPYVLVSNNIFPNQPMDSSDILSNSLPS
jgi:hypothetical protein